MKKLLITFFWFIPLVLGATNYHIKTGGNDAANGDITHPWATITKVNTVWTAGTFAPGDSINFNRGDTFYGTITIKESGSAGSPIIIGAYGSGYKPIITGFITISGWTNEGSGIYSKIVSCASSPNMVTIDGVNTPMGRYPNTGYLSIDSHVTNISITDATLPSLPNWEGAEVVIRKNRWTIDRSIITNHTGTTITYTSASAYEAKDGYGYFIQNDLETLDVLGEWYYNSGTSTFYMYFGAVNPTTKTIKVSAIDEIIHNATSPYYGYITFDNLNLQGANSKIINLKCAPYITVQNCNISYSGAGGIYGGANGGSNSNYFTLSNSIIDECNNYAIHIQSEFGNALISGNTITNIATIAGMGDLIGGNYKGILNGGIGTIIEYNTIFNIGYLAITGGGNNTKIRHNFIYNFCYTTDDGAGIYTYGPSFVGREITDNIVLNGIGAPNGTTSIVGDTYGIYLDDKSSDVIVARNTVANCGNGGIFLHNAHEIVIKNNISYNNKYQIYMVHDNVAPDDPIRNIDMTNNIFFAKGATQLCLNFSTVHDDITLFGTSNSNYFVRPTYDNLIITTLINEPEGPSITRTLSGWKTYSSQDAASFNSPVFLEDTTKIDFYYNPTSTPVIKALDVPMTDVGGTKYASEYTVPAWGSVILMEDSNPDAPLLPLYNTDGKVLFNSSGKQLITR